MQLITRAEWGARYANGATNDDGSPVILPMRWQDNWLHHSVTTWLPLDATLEQEIAAIREIERIGQGEFGQGISYTRIVCASGRIYEGHGLDRRGAHTYQRNDGSRAICLVGNYEHDQPTREQLLAVAAIVRDWHDRGYCPSPTLSGGHRDVYPTACPGAHAYAAIPEINRLAASGEPLDLEDSVSAADVTQGLFDTRVDGRNLYDWFRQIRAEQGVIRDQIVAQFTAQIVGLQAAVTTLAAKVGSGDGASAEEIEAAVAKAIRDNIVKVDVSVGGPPAAPAPSAGQTL